MKKTLQKIGILFTIFIAAIAIYFIAAQNTMEKEATVYTAMDEPTLPVVYPQVAGKEVNCLHGYLQDMGNQAARESITVLPENRALKLRIREYGNTVAGISYEIRSLDLDRLVEHTTIQDWDSQKDSITVTLPIQNLLTRNEPYLLNLSVITGEKTVSYYTRIMWADNNYAEDMIQLAEEFSRKTMDYNQARDLVTYLETSNMEDNSSLGRVTIKASFNHLTWDGLAAEMVGEPAVTLKEFDGIMGQVQVKYQVNLTESDGTSQLLDVEDNYTMRWDKQRIYMMYYQRNANQQFTVNDKSFNGKRILLGITNDDMVRCKKSPNSQYIAFKADRELWCYDQKGNNIVKIFTFKSGKDDQVRSGYDQHDIRILSTQDNGNVNFLVYGYMNRGEYEGVTGVVLYTYDKATDTVQEKFFIPAFENFDMVKADVEHLSFLSSNGMMYLLLDGTVYGIDLRSNESLVVAQGLTEGSYAVSEDQSRLAWQEGSDPLKSPKIHLMDLNTAQKQDIAGMKDDYVRVLGFVGNDLVYGLGNAGDVWMVNGRTRDLPMYAVYIMGTTMEVESEYQKQGVYISDVVVEDGRIHMSQLAKLSPQEYTFQNEDTIVCNEKFASDPLEGIGWLASPEKGKIYFVQTEHEIAGAQVKEHTPKTFSYEHTGTLEPVKTQKTDAQMTFYAYAAGHYIGASKNFKTAMDMAYGNMGLVTDENQHIVWDRINKRPIVSIKDPMTQAARLLRGVDEFSGSQTYEDGLMVVDARGCSLNQVLYFIDKGIPVLAYTQPGKYVLLSGYDQYNVTLYDPQTQTSEKMGLNDATAYFDTLKNDFIVGRTVQ